MGRIWKAYATRFHWLLVQAGARHPEKGVELLRRRALGRSQASGRPLAQALAEMVEQLERHPFFDRRSQPLSAERFWCDAGLGGLARWLRAAGYPAQWEPSIEDTQLLALARQDRAAVLTTDSMLMERKLLRDRVITAFWLPPVLSIEEQLEEVLRAFRLQLRAPTCMQCGGTLVPGTKEELRERIPPRTWRWLDDYFVCAGCGKLFWHGTHWAKIQARLRAVESRSRHSFGACK